jgi:rapamycin-insensitive companion of mTOR
VDFDFLLFPSTEFALTQSPNVAARLYATQFLMVLLRAKIPNFEVWGIPLLIRQTLDSDTSIKLSALEIIDEACHDRTYLEELVNVWPNFSAAIECDAGKLVEMRFYSIPRGINHPKAKIQDEIAIWVDRFNKRYVLLLEAETHSAMTLHTKSEDGTYSRRNCSARPMLLAPNILPHLYGQLVQTTKGMTCLQKYGDLPKLIEVLKHAKCGNETECLQLKAAIWALAHTATATDGVEFLNDPLSRVYEKLIFLAKYADNLSIRSTCLNALCLIGCTNAGANLLGKLEWVSVRHDRNVYWPVYEEEDWFSKQLTPVRHQLGDITPYNYTSLQEHASFLGVTATNNDEMSAFYFDETIENIQDDGDGLNEVGKEFVHDERKISRRISSPTGKNNI